MKQPKDIVTKVKLSASAMLALFVMTNVFAYVSCVLDSGFLAFVFGAWTVLSFGLTVLAGVVTLAGLEEMNK